MTFAETRRWPDNREIQTKALVYVGILSHYTGDATMPLHTTVDYDGRVGANGKSPQTGIHAKVDSLLAKTTWQSGEWTQNQTITPRPTLLPGIEAELKSSQALINSTYALESQLPSATGDGTHSPQMRGWTLERARARTRFTAQIFLNA